MGINQNYQGLLNSQQGLNSQTQAGLLQSAIGHFQVAQQQYDAMLEEQLFQYDAKLEEQLFQEWREEFFGDEEFFGVPSDDEPTIDYFAITREVSA